MVSNSNAIGNTSIGFTAAAVTIICLGTLHPLAKRTETTDGIFFQWVMCSAIWSVGLVIQLSIADRTQFEPIAVIGGFLWSTGNIIRFPTMQCLSLEICILIWGSLSLCVGWLEAKFGFIGMSAQQIPNPWLNTSGFIACLVSLGIFFFVDTIPQELFGVTEQLVDDLYADDDTKSEFDRKERAWHESMNPIAKKIFGFLGAVVVGLLFGTMFNPPQSLIDNPEKYIPRGGDPHSLRQVDYVFSHFTGVFVASTFFFIIYCSFNSFSQQESHINADIIIPSYSCGIIWGIAVTSWFIANEQLTMVVTFPIVISGSSVVSLLWSCLFLNEVTGKKNYIVLSAAIFMAGIGVSLVTLSIGLEEW